MEIKQAIELLERHNRWRQGAEIPMEEPHDITDSINAIVDYFKK